MLAFELFESLKLEVHDGCPSNGNSGFFFSSVNNMYPWLTEEGMRVIVIRREEKVRATAAARFILMHKIARCHMNHSKHEYIYIR